LNNIRNPTPEELYYGTIRKGCYHRNLNPQDAYDQFREKYGYSPPIAWANHCFFSQNRKMTVASQMKFARYCLRHTNSADEAIEIMQLEVGIEARWDEYKLKFLTCVREWESRVSLEIESLHASKGWRYKKFDIYHPALEKPHHEYIEDNDIYTLNDLVKAWEALSEEEQTAEKERVEQSLLGKHSPQSQTRQQKVKERQNTHYTSKARRKAASGYQQQQRYKRQSSRHENRSAKAKTSFVSSQAKFLKSKYHTIAELKTAYRNLSKKLHPDTGGNDEDFRQLLDEYERLKSQFR